MPDADAPQDWNPEPYMKRAMKFLLEHACAGLFLDPGLRKTSTTLGAFKVLRKKGVATRMLVVAPLRVCYSVWPKEVRKWKDFNGMRVEILHGPGKEDALNREADIYVINPEGLEWLFGVTKVKQIRFARKLLALDRPWTWPVNLQEMLVEALDPPKKKRLPSSEPEPPAFTFTAATRKEVLACVRDQRPLDGGALKELIKWLETHKGFDGFSFKKEYLYDYTRLDKLDADTLVIDEVSKFKRQSSGRFQMLRPVLPRFDRRWALTGSPAPNGLLDLFGIMYVIDLGRALGQFITHYRSAYFTPSYDGFGWTLQEDGEGRIYDRIKDTVFRLDGKDYLELPELVENVIKVELPPKVREIYDELETEFLAEIDDAVVTASNAGAKTTKLAQIANGGLFLPQEPDEQGRKPKEREWVHLHEEKTDVVEDMLEELNGSPAIVVYDFEHDLQRLTRRLGKDTAIIGGGVSAKKSDAIVDAWNAGQLPWLLGHAQAMAHGLNMQDGNAQHVIWHSMTFNYEDYDQLIRRLLRSGNKAKRIFVHLVVAKDTVDEAKLIALRRKRRDQGSLLDALKEYSKIRRRRR